MTSLAEVKLPKTFGRLTLKVPGKKRETWEHKSFVQPLRFTYDSASKVWRDMKDTLESELWGPDEMDAAMERVIDHMRWREASVDMYSDDFAALCWLGDEIEMCIAYLTKVEAEIAEGT